MPLTVSFVKQHCYFLQHPAESVNVYMFTKTVSGDPAVLLLQTLWRDQWDLINLALREMSENVQGSFNRRVGRPTDRQMFKQSVHSSIVKRGLPHLAASKADMVWWRLVTSCATFVSWVGRAGKRDRLYISKPWRQREESEHQVTRSGLHFMHHDSRARGSRAEGASLKSWVMNKRKWALLLDLVLYLNTHTHTHTHTCLPSAICSDSLALWYYSVWLA